MRAQPLAVGLGRMARDECDHTARGGEVFLEPVEDLAELDRVRGAVDAQALPGSASHWRMRRVELGVEAFRHERLAGQGGARVEAQITTACARGSPSGRTISCSTSSSVTFRPPTTPAGRFQTGRSSEPMSRMLATG